MPEIKTLQARYLRRLFLIYQEREGGFPSAKEWAKFLELNEKTLSALMNARNLASRKTALQICEKTGDYKLLDILGYAHPDEVSLPISSLPPGLQSLLRAALLEIEQALKNRGAQADSIEALEISKTILKKHGFSIDSIEMDE